MLNHIKTSWLKYLMVAILSVLTFVVVSSGCALPFQHKQTSTISQAVPGLQYGNGGALVQFIPADFAPVVNKVEPAVVRIVTQITTYWFRQPIPETGVGTGVLYSSNGYVLTNKHVVEGAESVKVYLADGREFDANHVWLAEDTDLAVLKIDGTGFPYAEFTLESNISAYEWVIAIGYPFDIGGAPTVSEGIISALGRSIQEQDGTVLDDVIQTTTAINPGNSGGPLVDLSGQVVGINTAILSSAENIGFAISVSTIDKFIQSLSSS